MIKRAEIGDRWVLVGFCKQCFDAGGFAENGYRFDDRSVLSGLTKFIYDANGSLVVKYEERERIQGLAIMTTVPSLMDSSYRQAVEVMWDANPRLPIVKRGKIMISLLQEMEKFAIEKNTDSILMNTKTNNACSAYLERNGYKLTSLFYTKGL